MRQNNTSGTGVNNTQNTPRAKRFPYFLRDMRKLTLSEEQIADFICKVESFVYLCCAKRTEQSTRNILEPLFSGVPETVPIFGSVRLATKRGSASFVIYVK